MTAEEEFKKARDSYRNARVAQQKRLKGWLKKDEWLRDHNLEVQEGGGHGRTSYGRKRLGKPYDLSNWLWITIWRADNHKDEALAISLQAPDRDESSKNHHVLMDRIAFIDPNRQDGSDGFGSNEDGSWGKVTAWVTDMELPDVDESKFLAAVHKCLEAYQDERLAEFLVEDHSRN